jgi:hypothetical protein
VQAINILKASDYFRHSNTGSVDIHHSILPNTTKN